jgi:FkbM family methyltransferase
MYSQNSEEQIIKDYFGGFVGAFLDVGANDGVTLSNTRALAEAGWCGVLVEPSPQAFARLKENCKQYKCLYPYPFALGNFNGEINLWESIGQHLNKGDVGLVSTTVTDEMRRWSGEKFNAVMVKCFRWKTFLNRLKYKKFDFISIDCEGMDLEVLKQIDLTDTKMVCVEWNGKNKQAFIDACPGFRLIHENGENLIFAR